MISKWLKAFRSCCCCWVCALQRSLTSFFYTSVSSVSPFAKVYIAVQFFVLFFRRKKNSFVKSIRILPHHRPNWTMNNQMCPAHNFRAFAFIRSNLSFDVMWIKSIFVCYAIASLIIFESLLLTRYVNAFSNDVNTPPNEVDSLTFQPKMYQLPAQQP